MSLFDCIGLIGTALILGAYALTVSGKVDPQRAPALLANFAGPSLILISLTRNFNLSAAIVEAVWAAIAVVGLIRLALRR